MLVFTAFAVAGSLPAQTLFQKPVKVLGDPHFIGTAAGPLQIDSDGPNVVEGRELNFPAGIAVDNSVNPPNIYIADSGNNRVLGFRYGTQTTAGATADLVLGQVDLFSNLAQGGANRSTGMNLPTALAVDASGNLYVADTGNNRVLRYPKPFSQAAGFAFPDLVVGQSSLSGKTANAGGLTATSLSLSTGSFNRSGIFVDAAGNLWVADSNNNRVLRFPAASLKAGQNAPAADLVLGQNDFTSSVALTSRTSKTGLSHPQAISFDPGGRLYVADQAARVLVYPAGVASGGAAARILGVDSTSSTGISQIGINSPYGVYAGGGPVVVSDSVNNRVLTFAPFDQWPSEGVQFSPSAIAVVGQSNYTAAKANGGAAEASASSLNFPTDIAGSGSETFVADSQNNRILVFGTSPSGLSSSASRVIGQLAFNYSSVNLIEGKEFNFVSAGISGSAVLDQSATPPHLYVADTLNNRVLGFKDFTRAQAGQAADLVIGQPDLFRAVVNYPAGDAALPNSKSLHLPTALSVDSAGNLYVADSGNSRILRFPAPFASGANALEAADLVIGQQDFSSILTDPTDRTLDVPEGLTLTADGADVSKTNSGYLIVSDTLNNRVLLFAKPFSSGMSATKVLGQLNFTTNATSADPQRFAQPRGVAVDPSDRVLVADTGNHRIQIFDTASNLANYPTRTVSLTSFSAPLSISTSAKGFWVADSGLTGVTHFPPVDQLIVSANPNNTADAAVAALSPRSVFTDKFNNLVVADGANRVLYFVPQISVTNAANYSTRAVTAGEIAALFAPAASTTTLASGMGTATSLPLPTTLGDTQVLINGVAVPLFYVSPSQINLQLPNGLASGGSADLQIVGQSTGQIFGGAELQLATASPGLFTANATGSGQVAALNQDLTVNSAANPAPRGQYIILYGTGVGPVTGAPADGSAPTGATPASPLPQVLLGSGSTTFLPPDNIAYSGLAPTLVGVWQINVLIPQTAQTGASVPIRVFQNSISSTDSSSTVPTNTTIAIK